MYLISSKFKSVSAPFQWFAEDSDITQHDIYISYEICSYIAVCLTGCHISDRTQKETAHILPAQGEL